MSVGLVVFDCDGVLVDTERITVGIEARVLTELGWPMTAEEVVRRWMGKASQTQLDDLRVRLGEVAMREFDERLSRELAVAFEADLTAVEGVSALVERLHDARVPTCVASSGTHDRIRQTLGITGLFDRFDGRIFSATEVARGKPAPDLFLHAAQSLGVPPSACVVIEDSVYGVQAGVAAGMAVYGFAGGLTEADALIEAGATTFERMSDLVGPLTDGQHAADGRG